MNTHTNALQPKNKFHRTTRNNLFQNTVIITVILALVAVAAIAIYMANRPVVVAASSPAVAYGNALEMQYAQPWLAPHNKPVASYGNALELLYAKSWLETQHKMVTAYSNALELQYAQPWLQKSNQLIAVTGGEMPLNCQSSLETLYACKYGYGQP